MRGAFGRFANIYPGSKVVCGEYKGYTHCFCDFVVEKKVG